MREDAPLSRRALLTLGLSRLGGAVRPEPAAPAPPPIDPEHLAFAQADLHALTTEPVDTLTALAAPVGGDELVVVRGGGLEDRFEDHEGLVAVVEPAELEDLPFDDGSLDLALAPFAPFYSPRPSVALRELARVVRPGGRLALTSWADFGAVGRVLRAVVGWDPEIDTRLAWGAEARLREELAPLADEVAIHVRDVALRDVTAADAERALPPVAAALTSFPGADANGLRAEAARLLGDAPDGRYLVAVIRCRSRP